MNKSGKVLVIWFTAVLLVAATSSPAPGVEKGTPQSGGAAFEIKPLKQPLRMGTVVPTFCATLQQASGRASKLHHELAMLLGSQGIMLQGVGQTHAEFVDKQSCCSQNKSFSVQDQQAAGCANSDTVGQCMDKLTKYCVKSVAASKQLGTKLQDDQQRTANIAATSTLLSDQLKLLLNMVQ